MNPEVTERRSGAGFAAKTLQRLRILGNILGKELEGDRAAEHGVLGLVNHTHAATAQLLDDPVMRDGLA
jgi:hypothetical protein